MPSFDRQERVRQIAYLERACVGQTGFAGSPIRLQKDFRSSNLAPDIRNSAQAFFNDGKIQWHQHANHGLSSQVCCVNFLAPLATRKEMLAQLIGSALGIAAPRMLPVGTGPNGEDWFVDFEHIGGVDYLNEWPVDGKATRGANATAADAMVRFETEEGEENLLIEWKYTERYGQAIAPNGNGTRIARYQNIAFAPDGPIRTDLGLKLEDFFWEPFYQLLRQQMLASRMQADPNEPAGRVRVLHISPDGNNALKKVTAPALRRFGENAFAVFKEVLVRPEDFISRSTETLFLPLLKSASARDNAWASYLLDRYDFLQDGAERAQSAEA